MLESLKSKVKEPNYQEVLEGVIPALRGLELTEVDKDLFEMAKGEAEAFFVQGKPLLAAASYLSVSEFRQAIIILIRCNELYLAYFISKIFYPLALKETALMLSEKCEKYF